MMRAILVGVSIVMLGLPITASAGATKALSPPPPYKTDEPTVTKWMASYLDTDGWFEISWSDEVIRFITKSGIEEGVLPNSVRIWVRQEHFTPIEGPIRSVLLLTEYDCGEARYRVLAEDVYPYNNMQGTASKFDEQDPKWVFPRPLTIAATEVKMICDIRNGKDTTATASDGTGAPTTTWAVLPAPGK